MAKTLPEDVLYQGISVDIAFADPRPAFGDLFLVCGDTHPRFPATGVFGLERLADLQFEQVDDYFGVRAQSDEAPTCRSGFTRWWARSRSITTLARSTACGWSTTSSVTQFAGPSTSYGACLSSRPSGPVPCTATGAPTSGRRRICRNCRPTSRQSSGTGPRWASRSAQTTRSP